jgi:hypothetical protein
VYFTADIINQLYKCATSGSSPKAGYQTAGNQINLLLRSKKKSPAGKQGRLGISNLNAMNPGKIQVLILPGCKACINYLLPIY